MSNPIRPWFRLSSIARPTPQGSTEPVQPRPAAPRGPAPVVRPAVAPPPSNPPPPRAPSPPPPPPPRAPSPPPPPSPRAPSPPPPPPRQATPPPRAPSPPRSAVRQSPPPPPAPKSPPLPPQPLSPKEVKEALVRIGEPQRKPLSPPQYPYMMRKPSPDPSLRSVKPEAPQTPPDPPKPKAPSPKLSPYSLPPSQLRSQPEDQTTQKKVLTVEKASQVHGPKEHHHAGKTKKILPSDSEDMGTRVITIAGENKGAVMEILRSPRKGDPKHLTKTGQSRVLKSGSSSSSDEGEGKKKNKGKMMNSNGTLPLPLKAFMNSNVQLINNSIVYNSSANHHDPGVHLSLSRKPGNGFHVKDHGNGYTS